MRKDIKIPDVKNVFVAVVKDDVDEWNVYVINNNSVPITDALVVTRGYGVKNGEKVKTSTLRHYLGTIAPKGNCTVEKIDPALFELNHEFWLTFYIEEHIYDKKFLFEADTLSEENLSYIKELNAEGIIYSS